MYSILATDGEVVCTLDTGSHSTVGNYTPAVTRTAYRTWKNVKEEEEDITNSYEDTFIEQGRMRWRAKLIHNTNNMLHNTATWLSIITDLPIVRVHSPGLLIWSPAWYRSGCCQCSVCASLGGARHTRQWGGSRRSMRSYLTIVLFGLLAGISTENK